MEKTLTISTYTFTYNKTSQTFNTKGGIQILPKMLYSLLDNNDELYVTNFIRVVTLLDLVDTSDDEYVVSLADKNTCCRPVSTSALWFLTFMKKVQRYCTTINIRNEHCSNILASVRSDSLTLQLNDVDIATLPENIDNINLMIKICQQKNVVDNLVLLVKNLCPNITHPVRLMMQCFNEETKYKILPERFCITINFEREKLDNAENKYIDFAVELDALNTCFMREQREIQSYKDNLERMQNEMVVIQEKLRNSENNSQRIEINIIKMKKLAEDHIVKSCNDNFQTLSRQMKRTKMLFCDNNDMIADNNDIITDNNNIITDNNDIITGNNNVITNNDENEMKAIVLDINGNEVVVKGTLRECQMMRAIINQFKSKSLPVTKEIFMSDPATFAESIKGLNFDARYLFSEFFNLSESQQKSVLANIS